MTAVFRDLLMGTLRFTPKAAQRMGESGRFVPVSILKIAIKYGARDADPGGGAGCMRYSVKMLRNEKEYTLRVIYRLKDSTIVHFHYEK